MGRTFVIKKEPSKTRFYIILFFAIFALIFVRYCYFGLKYYCQLDDYIQYHNYETSGKSLPFLVKTLGLMSSRPLAGLCDILIWSHFYQFMIAVVGIISAMYAASAVFFHRVFSRHFGTGYIFFIFYALLPTGFEGTYWVSASSRIVVGLFFASLSLLNFDEWCVEGKRWNLVLFSIFQFISFCFYEQIVLLSGAATFIVMLGGMKKQYKRRSLWGLLMFAGAAGYILITKLFPSGTYGERSALFLPWKKDYFEMILVPVTEQLKQVFIYGSGAICGKGFVRGFRLIAQKPNYLYLVIVLAAASGLFLTVKKAGRFQSRFFAQLISGIFLAIIPTVIFFIIKTPWFGFRNAVTSYCGIALVIDALFGLIFGRFKKGYVAEAALISVLAVLCCVSSVSELHDYRETTAADTKIAVAAAEAVGKSAPAGSRENIWLLNVDASYVSDGNYYFHEHDYGVTSSSWAISGAIAAIAGGSAFPEIQKFTPISSKTPFASEKSAIGKSPAYWYTGDSFVPVTIVASNEKTWKILNGSGAALGTLQYAGGVVTLGLK